MRTKDIKVGVIGYGGAFAMGKYHLDFAQRAGMTPAAVCDMDPTRLAVAEADFPGIQTYSSVDEMLANSDLGLVIVITPHNTHSELAIKCLKAGKHVIVEKPMAITTKECDAMIKAAAAGGLVLSAFHNRHWDGCIVQAVKDIQTGMIGEIFRIEAHMNTYAQPRDWWRTSKTISGGVLFDWGVHLLEYTLQLMQSDIAEVSGFAKRGFWAKHTVWNDDTNEDEGFLVVRYGNGKWSSLSISGIDSNPKPYWLEVTGTLGSYLFDYDSWKVISQRDGKTWQAEGKPPESEWWRYYQNIADHIARNKQLIITPEWSRRPIHILDLACRSAEQGKALPARYA